MALDRYTDVNEMIHHNITSCSNNAESISCEIIRRDNSILSNVSRFQLNFLEYLNEAYYAVTRYMWMPLLPRDEMNSDELYLASLEILETMGILDCKKTRMTTVEGSDWRRIFQYGDVLTIQKLHQLNPSVLRAMTHVGKENHAKMIHSHLNDTCILNHDYLHENIHRLQAVYKIFYPGFIEACVRVLETKQVGHDPTEGRWKDHEDLTIKIITALKRLRLDKYISAAPMNWSLNADTPSENLKQFMLQYDKYCDALLSSSNEITRYVSRFLVMAEKWYLCKEAVRVADWALLEVESVDWVPVWGISKKPQYQMESMRRIEVNYTLSSEELEYMRMGRFVRMHANGNFMSFDDFCKKHNMALKQSMNNADINVMCRKSRHLHSASRCAKMVFGFEGKSRTCPTLATDDIRALYLYFSNCNVFSNRVDTPSTLNDSVFMTNSASKKKIEEQRRKALSTREKRHLSLNGDDSEDDYGDNVKSENDNDDDDDDNDDISCNLIRHVDSEDDLENNSIDGGGSICGSVGSTDDKPRNVVKEKKRTKLTKLEISGLLDVFLLETTTVKKAIDS